MPFFVFSVSNEKEENWDLYVKFFNDESEKSEFLSSTLVKGDELFYLKGDSLKAIISQKYYQFWDSHGETVTSNDVYNDMVEEFGIDLIRREFPNEKVDENFFKEVVEYCEQIHQQMVDDYYENYDEYEKENQNYDHYETETDVYDDEIRKWDEETGGSWRIENDFG